ncbi:MAG: hypothetical protein XD81_1329 [Bacteroidetes bacterium 38_7]|nr:MAG: hypothetical protein XD81_1329 [Bacteroidetes bacterium 38_7]HAL64555.1 DUF389 domain-containing protein [Bacteroidales bacterium]
MNIEKIFQYLDLREHMEDYATVHQEIDKGAAFRGANLWILACAIMVASVGLNMNSTAVIIGAMLISPLMGPINGIGYSIAIYDFALLRKSLKNFGFAVLAGLLVSGLYFFISPLSSAHSELLARTSPSIYDVLIAFFGGLAGIIAVSSRIKGTVIPGVAIATALMPPLCTAGYGLATLQPSFFFGALYLFTINTVFIALAALLISRILKFPILEDVTLEKAKIIRRYIYSIIAVTLIPSIYFGYLLAQKERFIESSNKYINNVRIFEGSYLLDSEVDPRKKIINLTYGGLALDEEAKRVIQQKASDFGIKAKIEISQGFAYQMPKQETDDKTKLLLRINALEAELNKSKTRLDSINKRPMLALDLLDELKILNQNIASCALADTYVIESDTSSRKITVVMVGYLGEELSQDEEDKIRLWLEVRLKTSELLVFFNEVPSQ